MSVKIAKFEIETLVKLKLITVLFIHRLSKNIYCFSNIDFNINLFILKNMYL